MDIHINNNDNDHRVDLQSRRRYTNMISRFCNLLAQQPSHRHMIRHDNNGDLVLIYNRLDVATVKTYTEHLCRRLGRYPHWSTVMKMGVTPCKWIVVQYVVQYVPCGTTTIHTALRIRPFIIHKQICFGFLRLAVLLVRARKRANNRLYIPGGAGYERCREEFYNHASISEKIHSNSGWTYWHTNIGWRYGICIWYVCMNYAHIWYVYDILMISS